MNEEKKLFQCQICGREYERAEGTCDCGADLTIYGKWILEEPGPEPPEPDPSEPETPEPESPEPEPPETAATRTRPAQAKTAEDWVEIPSGRGGRSRWGSWCLRALFSGSSAGEKE